MMLSTHTMLHVLGTDEHADATELLWAQDEQQLRILPEFLHFVRHVAPLLALSEVPPRAVYVYAAHWRKGTAPAEQYSAMEDAGDMPRGSSGQTEQGAILGGSAYVIESILYAVHCTVHCILLIFL